VSQIFGENSSKIAAGGGILGKEERVHYPPSLSLPSFSFPSFFFGTSRCGVIVDKVVPRTHFRPRQPGVRPGAVIEAEKASPTTGYTPNQA